MNDFYLKYPTFDIDFYQNHYPDLHKIRGDKFKLIRHYEKYGFKEGRKINKNDSKKKKNKKFLFKEYPNLFHKFILNLENYNKSNINYYEFKKDFVLKSCYICHIHCFKISYLETMFQEYLILLNSFFSIIVTFNELDNNNILNNFFFQNIVFLQCKNKGYDVGPKFVVAQYLKEKNHDYKYIFFIHSKTKEEKRKEYLEPFIENMDKIKNLLTIGKIGSIFNDIIYCANQVIFIHNQLIHININDIHWDNNTIYMNDLIKYFDLNKENYLFSEGNFFILHKKVIDLLYSDSLLYTILNEEKSFDFNWVNKRYDLKETCFKKVFEEYKNNNWYGNNLETKLGWNGYADGMLEHSFERLPLLLTNHLKMEIKIFSKKPANLNSISYIEKLVNSIIHTNQQYIYF